MDSLLNGTTATYTPLTGESSTELCRDRNGEFPPAIYNLITCVLCYSFVYIDYNVSVDYETFELVTGRNTKYQEGTRISVNPDDPESISKVCGSLVEPSECWKWQECCRQAKTCCQEQISQGPRLYQDYGRTLCPRTWDGYACWPDTPAGKRPRITCPAHMPVPITGRKSNMGLYAYKTCTRNGTWFVNEISNREWTDYTECGSIDHYQRLHKAVLVCTSITIVFIIPACIIFLYYRPLRQQHRIRLHICLMISSFVTSVSMILWEIFINKDTMDSEMISDRIAYKNSVGCRLLSVLTRYSELASFMWMFVEGFHLHRLLVHAFAVPKALLPYYIFGFGFPLLPVTVYSIIRATNNTFNQKCWIDSIDEYEWIIYVPSLIALLANLFFLLRIVFIMVRQLEPHPNEPSNFRRAVKAVVVLVPLFGVQFLLFVYRPQEITPFSNTYELLSKISSSLQGTFIAIIFCYLSKEVQGHLKTSCMRLLRQSRRKDANCRSFTMTTQFASEISTRSCNGGGDPSPMISLNPIYKCQPSTEEMTADLLNGDLHRSHDNVEEVSPLSHGRDSS